LGNLINLAPLEAMHTYPLIVVNTIPPSLRVDIFLLPQTHQTSIFVFIMINRGSRECQIIIYPVKDRSGSCLQRMRGRIY